MICDDLVAQVSEWIEQTDHCLARYTIYDIGVCAYLTKVRASARFSASLLVLKTHPTVSFRSDY